METRNIATFKWKFLLHEFLKLHCTSNQSFDNFHLGFVQPKASAGRLFQQPRDATRSSWNGLTGPLTEDNSVVARSEAAWST